MNFKKWCLAIIALPILVSHIDKDHPGSVRTDHTKPNVLFLIADDWSYPHAGIYGDKNVRTPTFDWIAQHGASFSHAFCAAPSCSPSRASILTSRYPHQLESAGNLWSIFPNKFSNWVSILNEHGYHTGKSRKGWAPGDFEKGGYKHNPAGKNYESFEDFIQHRKKGQPFSFWFGSSDPHRPYEPNSGVKTGMDRQTVEVPGFLPDVDCVRNDILDYYYEIERFDRECGAILHKIDQMGELENTLIIMTSDNGMPFPRAKANLYDYGTRMPLAIFWPKGLRDGRNIEEFVNFIDLGPTILEVANIDIPDDFSGHSVLSLLNGSEDGRPRDHVFVERERHANVRKGDLSYPSRGIRTRDYLLIKNFEPDRWPAGDPSTHQSVGQYGDVDNSISKFLILAGRDDPDSRRLFDLSFSKRPTIELYEVKSDPYNLINRAEDPALQGKKKELLNTLDAWMSSSGDRRYENPRTNYWDIQVYTPTYQRSDFNLEQSIADYKQAKHIGYGRFELIPCINE